MDLALVQVVMALKPASVALQLFHLLLACLLQHGRDTAVFPKMFQLARRHLAENHDALYRKYAEAEANQAQTLALLACQDC